MCLGRFLQCISPFILIDVDVLVLFPCKVLGGNSSAIVPVSPGLI